MQPRPGACALARIAPALLVLPFVIPSHLFGIGDCSGPSSPCERIEPGMVVFIGTPVSIARERHRVTVTFDIRELLWGPRGLRSIRVLFDGYINTAGPPEFFAVKALRDGPYVQDSCSGLNLPVSHPFVEEYRRSAAAHRPASISVKAQWHWHVPIAGAQIRLTGNGRTFRGSIDGEAGWKVAALPPGIYEVAATRPNFFQEWPVSEVSIPPAACGDLRILMETASEVTGSIVDARGEPVRNATFHLTGQGRAQWEHALSLTSLRDAVFRRLGWTSSRDREYRLDNRTRTDNHGRFAFRNVFPGEYYLSSDISEVSPNFQIPLPNTYYPGVYRWQDAQRLVVPEGRSIRDVLFRLPDFGPKRRVTISVLSEDGMPVPGAIVQDSGLDPANQAAANSGAHTKTGAGGQVILRLWTIGDYRVTATLWADRGSWSGEPVPIPPGQFDLKRTIVLRGLRMKDRR